MDKPITVARQEFMEKMAELINKSNLPSFVIADIFELTIPSLRDYAKLQYENDLTIYKKEENDDDTSK